ncbi:LHFPL tetraspan subfamily member 6 protein-like isoform X2 [Planococcus citri]
MTNTLSGVGMCWAFLSVTASVLCCSGYYLPYWIQGRLFGRADTYFGPFRRCNYPKVNSLGLIDIIYECGRYSKFSDIPSIWWQCTTILVGLGCALTLLVAITATSACCFSHIIQNSTAKAAGVLQLIAALLVCGGGAVYPVGWDNRELKQSCGNSSAVYKLGTCQLSWSVYLLGSAVALLLLCFALSFCSAREPSEHPSFRMSPYPDGIASVT